jgi:hypothetical protein
MPGQTTNAAESEPKTPGRKSPVTAASNGSRAVHRLTAFLRNYALFEQGLLLIAIAAGAALAASDFLVLRHLEVFGSTCERVADPALVGQCSQTGGDHHSYALVVLGVVCAGIATLGLASPRARLQVCLAILAIGTCALVIALVGDFSQVGQRGPVGWSFADVRVAPGPALWVELAGSAVAIAASGLCLSVYRLRLQSSETPDPVAV